MYQKTSRITANIECLEIQAVSARYNTLKLKKFFKGLTYNSSLLDQT